MTQASSTVQGPNKQAWPADTGVGTVVPVRAGFNLSGLGTLFWLTLRQHARGMRLGMVCALFLLPTFIAVLVKVASPHVPAQHLEEVLIFYILPHVLVPLTALLYASGMIQDEIEEQTLTYLLVRPLPRWAIYLTKLLATVLICAALAAVFTPISYAALAWGDAEYAGKIFPQRPLQVAGLFALSLFAYCSLFGFLSLFLRRSLVTGVIYIAVFEGLLANIDFAFRHLTVVYYFRVLCARWLELNPRSWRLDLKTAPSAESVVQILVATSLAFAVCAALLFARREFRVKTPEGS